MSRSDLYFFPGLLILAVLAGPFEAPIARAGGFHATQASHHQASQDACACASARASSDWCSACGVGYLAALRIPSMALFEFLDPHGHEVDPAGVSCQICRSALSSNGFCEEHHIGYAEGRAYVTRLAFLVARGEPVESSADYKRLEKALEFLDRCEYCAVALFANGRCPTCNVHYRAGRAVAAAQGVPR